MPQRDSEAGISVDFSHEPFAYWKKSVQASADLSRFDTLKPLLCAKAETQSENSKAVAVSDLNEACTFVVLLKKCPKYYG